MSNALSTRQNVGTDVDGRAQCVADSNFVRRNAVRGRGDGKAMAWEPVYGFALDCDLVHVRMEGLHDYDSRVVVDVGPVDMFEASIRARCSSSRRRRSAFLCAISKRRTSSIWARVRYGSMKNEKR